MKSSIPARGRTVAIVEARMASTRLPGKVLREILDVPLLGHLIARLETCRSLDDIIVACTQHAADDAIVGYCQSQGIATFRGDETDVMGRVIQAAEASHADVIVETTGDNPVIDPEIIDHHVEMYFANDVDYVSNVVIPSYPDGMDVQVFSLNVLRRSEEATTAPLDREHVTRHIRQNPKQFSRINIIAPQALQRRDLCVTVDVPEDFIVVQKVLEGLRTGDRAFGCMELVEFLDRNPSIARVNADVRRRGMDS